MQRGTRPIAASIIASDSIIARSTFYPSHPVHDVVGRQMTRLSVSGGRYEIDVNGWAKGLYTLAVSQEGKIRYTVKVIKD